MRKQIIPYLFVLVALLLVSCSSSSSESDPTANTVLPSAVGVDYTN